MSNSANSKFQPPQSPQTLGQTLTPYYVSRSGRVPVRPTFRAFFFVFFCVLVRATFCGSFHGYLAKPNLCSRAVLDGFSTFWLVQVVVGVLAK